jgi:hypothetical protein
MLSLEHIFLTSTIFSTSFHTLNSALEQIPEPYDSAVFQYACRKALADNQPRIRGRFAKTEESDAKRQ